MTACCSPDRWGLKPQLCGAQRLGALELREEGYEEGLLLPLLSKAPAWFSSWPPSPLSPFLLSLMSPLSPWGPQRHCLVPQGPEGADQDPTWLPIHTNKHHAYTPSPPAKKKGAWPAREMAGTGGATPFSQQLPIHSPLPSPHLPLRAWLYLHTGFLPAPPH